MRTKSLLEHFLPKEIDEEAVYEINSKLKSKTLSASFTSQ